MNQVSLSLTTSSEAETRALGEKLGSVLRAGDVVLLHGDLGAGKTTLAQGIAKGLGIEEYVQSPTFTLVAEHTARLPSGEPLFLHHIDLYRLDDPGQLESFGYEDLVTQNNGVVVVEWPERAGGDLPDDYLLIVIEPSGPDERQLQISAEPADGSSRALVDVLREAQPNG